MIRNNPHCFIVQQRPAIKMAVYDKRNAIQILKRFSAGSTTEKLALVDQLLEIEPPDLACSGIDPQSIVFLSHA